MFSRFNSIMVGPVRDLEKGDLIAFQVLGCVETTRITGLADYVYQLTDAQKQYMRENNLHIPENPYELIAGNGARLIFGTFEGNVIARGHVYLPNDVNVAVFPRKRD